MPIQVTKVDRINLKFVSELLEDEEIGFSTKIFYLVRDPRAVMHSRKDFPWCVKTKECFDPTYLCQDMVQDYYESQRLLKLSPNNFMYVSFCVNFLTKIIDIYFHNQFLTAS